MQRHKRIKWRGVSVLERLFPAQTRERGRWKQSAAMAAGSLIQLIIGNRPICTPPMKSSRLSHQPFKLIPALQGSQLREPALPKIAPWGPINTRHSTHPAHNNLLLFGTLVFSISRMRVCISPAYDSLHRSVPYSNAVTCDVCSCCVYSVLPAVVLMPRSKGQPFWRG